MDRAEAEPNDRVNAEAPFLWQRSRGGSLLQVSTDFVFNGAQGTPYRIDQAVDPLGVYGRTKAAGEQAAAEALPAERLCILRTSWVYGPVMLTMLKLHAIKAAIPDENPGADGHTIHHCGAAIGTIRSINLWHR